MGTDVNASASASSSATSGVQNNQRITYGDVITGGGSKPTPPYLWLGLAAVALVLGAIFLVRR